MDEVKEIQEIPEEILPIKRQPIRQARERKLLQVSTISFKKKKDGAKKPKQKSILQIYKQAQNLVKFKTSGLETVYEEPKTIKDRLSVFGTTKLKRQLNCSDGQNITKTRIKSRKAHIKRIFGNRRGKTKVSMEEVKRKLKDSDEETEAPTYIVNNDDSNAQDAMC